MAFVAVIVAFLNFALTFVPAALITVVLLIIFGKPFSRNRRCW